MTRAVKHLALWTAALALALSAAPATKAYAEEPGKSATPSLAKRLTGVCFAHSITRVYVPMKGGKFKVTVPLQKLAFLQFPETIKLQEGLFVHGGFTMKQTKHTLTIAPSATLKDGDSSNLVIRAGDLRTTAELVFSATLTQPASILDVTPLPVKDFARHKAEHQAKQAKQERERDAVIMQKYRRGVAGMLLSMKVMRPSGPRIAALGESTPSHYAPDGEIRAVLTRLLETEEGRYMEVVVENRTNSKFQVESTYLSDGLDAGVPVDVQFEKPVKANGKLLAVIPARGKVRGMVVVPDGVTSGIDALRLQLRAPPGLTSVVAQRVVEIWPRMPEHLARKRRWDKQAVLTVRMLGGGFWTGDAIDGTEATAGAGMTALSMRIGKGMHHNFAFEAEVAGGFTGQAMFRDADWLGMEGDIARQASFTRAQGFGVIRFGHRYVSSMRLGVGVQGTNYDSRFTTVGSTMDGPGASFEIDGVWSVGGAFDARIRENWTLGAGATFSDAFNTGYRSVELGVQFGYRWTQL